MPRSRPKEPGGNPRWSWHEAPVDLAGEHIELRYGDASRAGYEQWTPVALVGKPKCCTFPVEWLLAASANPEIISKVQRELDFYLVEHPKEFPGTGGPWEYAIYHCGTAANIYARVHWSYFPSGRHGERHSSMVVHLSAREAARLFGNHEQSQRTDE
jgi:hypothetical protein